GIVSGQVDVGEEQPGQRRRQFALVAEGGNVEGDDDGDAGDEHDRDQGSGDDLRQLRHENEHDDAQDQKRVDHPGHPDDMRHLSGVDEYGQGVDVVNHTA